MYQGKWTQKAVAKRNKKRKASARRARRARRRRRLVSRAMFTVSFLLVLYAFGQIRGYFTDLKTSEESNQQLLDFAVETVPKTTQPMQESEPEQVTEILTQNATIPPQMEPEESPVETAPIRVDFQALQLTSDDFIGWLYSPNTVINYPVMRSKNNLDYIRTLPDKTPNDTGSLFLDYRNGADFLTGYSVIYGHNIKNDTMFGTLEEYKDQAYYDEHSVLYLITPEASYRIDLVAGVVTYGTSDYYDIPMQPDAAKKMVEEAITNSTFVPAKRPESEKYVLLSTCSYEYDDGRYILIGALTQIENA